MLAGVLILAVSRPTQSGKDQTQAWEDYRKSVRERERIDNAERDRVQKIIKDRADMYYAELKAKYPVGGAVGGSPIGEPINFDYGPDIASKYYAQPDPVKQETDISGLYYQRTIVGKNAGEWSMQFISGP